MKTNSKGFSLVELMVVIAIIGILASMAVPRFNTFIARAYQAEAKSILNGIYTFQTTEFSALGDLTTRQLDPLAVLPFSGNFNLRDDGTGTGTNYYATKGGYIFFLCAVAHGGNPACNMGGGFSQPAVGAAWTARTRTLQPFVKGDNTTYDRLRIGGNKLMCAPYDGITGFIASSIPGSPSYCPQQKGNNETFSEINPEDLVDYY